MRLTSGLAASCLAFLTASQAGAACKVGYFAALPVSVESGQLMTSASINGQSITFDVESSSFYSFLDRSTTQALKLVARPISLNYTIYSGGKSVPTTITQVSELKFGKRAIANPRFLVLGGDDPRSGNRIGQNILGINDAEFDVQGGVIRLTNPHGCAGPDMAYWAWPDAVRSVALEIPDALNRLTIGKVAINGRPMRALFSTGSSQTRLTLKAARALAGSADAQADLSSLKLASLDIGGEVRNDVTLEVTPGALLADVDMVIGLDFFRTHRIYVSNGRRALYFTANDAPVASAATP